MTNIESFTNLVQNHQQQRDDLGNVVVEHLMEVPGMADMFDTEESRLMLGQQIALIIETRVRVKTTAAPEPLQEPVPLEVPPAPDPEPSDGNGSAGE